MLELGIGADVVRGIGWVFWGLIAIGLWLAISKPKKGAGKAICVALVLAVPSAILGPSVYRNYEYRQHYAVAKALFDERCKTAGEKIFRTVDHVEGVLLLHVRREVTDADRHDPNWPDAGLPQQYGGDAYVYSFLAWENQFRPSTRGVLNSRPQPENFSISLPGYEFVDVKEDEETYRYRLPTIPGDRLQRTVVKESPARYAISFANNIASEDRENWIAGTTVTVIDTKTTQTIAEKTWYSFEPGLGSTSGARTPWAYAITCPDGQGSTARDATRFFVDQILKPRKGS